MAAYDWKTTRNALASRLGTATGADYDIGSRIRADLESLGGDYDQAYTLELDAKRMADEEAYQLALNAWTNERDVIVSRLASASGLSARLAEEYKAALERIDNGKPSPPRAQMRWNRELPPGASPIYGPITGSSSVGDRITLHRALFADVVDVEKVLATHVGHAQSWLAVVGP